MLNGSKDARVISMEPTDFVSCRSENPNFLHLRVLNRFPHSFGCERERELAGVYLRGEIEETHGSTLISAGPDMAGE